MLNNAQIDNNHEIQVLNADATPAARLAPALGAMIFGLTILLITAFAPVQAVHNATHDTRHAFNV
ncbi:MAG: CbtB domain-containing protein [Candidatus Methylumidiphilus sp.]